MQGAINISNIYKKGYLYSACILNQNNNYYIVSSNYNLYQSENIKIYNFEGQKIDEINESREKTFYLDNFFDSKNNINYIIVATDTSIKSYNFNQKSIYKKYFDKDDSSENYCFIIKIIQNIIKLVESSKNGNIRIWNFDSGELLKKFKIANCSIYDICEWNDDYIYCGCEDKTIIAVNIENEQKHILKGHTNIVCCIRKIFHPGIGTCLISQGKGADQIKVWIK